MTKATLVLSGGGLDTLVAAWSSHETHPAPMRLVFFDYGQKAVDQEWDATKAIAQAMNREDLRRQPHKRRGIVLVQRIPLPFYSDYIPSALTAVDAPIETNPQPGVAHEWVPARNTVFVALALAYAESGNYGRIVTGINATAAVAYSDNSKGWHDAWRMLITYATPERIELDSPLVALTKTDIVHYGEAMGVPWDTDTWSCYAGGQYHCGLCSSCRTRRDAFRMAGVEDPTEYAE